MARTSMRKQYKKTTRTRRIITIAVAAVLLLAILAGVLVNVRNNRREARQAAAEKALQERIVKVTFPEGSTVLDIAQKLEENNVCTADEFEAVCTKVPEGYDRLFADVTTDNKVFVLEGYLFPSTYEFYKEEGAEKAVKRFLDATNKQITDEDLAKVNSMGYTLDQVHPRPGPDPRFHHPVRGLRPREYADGVERLRQSPQTGLRLRLPRFRRHPPLHRAGDEGVHRRAGHGL